MTGPVGARSAWVGERYEVLQVVPSAGSARVLKALDRRDGGLVALRMVAAGAQHDALARRGRLLGDLSPPPSLARVRDGFFDGDRYVLVMDWVEGTDLETLRRGRVEPGLAP